MVAISKQTDSPSRPAAVVTRPDGGSRDPQLQVSDLVVGFGVLRGVHAQASDPLSRVLRRAVYLPGV